MLQLQLMGHKGSYFFHVLIILWAIYKSSLVKLFKDIDKD